MKCRSRPSFASVSDIGTLLTTPGETLSALPLQCLLSGAKRTCVSGAVMSANDQSGRLCRSKYCRDVLCSTPCRDVLKCKRFEEEATNVGFSPLSKTPIPAGNDQTVTLRRRWICDPVVAGDDSLQFACQHLWNCT